MLSPSFLFSMSCQSPSVTNGIKGEKVLKDFQTTKSPVLVRLILLLRYRNRILISITFCSYPKGGTFITKLDLKSAGWRMIKHKTVFEARNPAFWVGAVSGSYSFSLFKYSSVKCPFCLGFENLSAL